MEVRVLFWAPNSRFEPLRVVETPDKKARFVRAFLLPVVLWRQRPPLALADAFTHITELEGFELAREWRGTPAKAGERVDDLQPRSSATLERERSATVSFYR